MTVSLGNIIMQDAIWQVQGPMGFADVERLLSVTVQASNVTLGHSLVIDLSGVTDVDTASISLLMEWQRWAHQHRCELTFRHLPKNLSALGAVYEVLDLIPVVQ